MDIKTLTLNLAISMTLILGIASSASANTEQYQSGTPEQHAAIGKVYSEYENKLLPLQQKIIVKKSELDALLYVNNEENTTKIQSVIKEIGDLKAQRYAVRSELRSKLSEFGFYSSPSRMHSEHRMMNRHNRMDSDYRGCGYHW